MRIVFASLAPLAVLAAAPLAAKPQGGQPLDPAREYYRGDGVTLCVAEMRTVESVTWEEQEILCGCAFNRFMPGRATAALPRLDRGGFIRVMGSELLACAAGENADLAARVARRLAQAPAAAEPPVLVPIAPAAGAGAAPDKPEPSGSGRDFDFRAWLGGLSLPGWLAGLPLWAWLPIALLVFALLRALIRRRDPRQDLLGPPRSMRPGGRLGPPPR